IQAMLKAKQEEIKRKFQAMQQGQQPAQFQPQQQQQQQQQQRQQQSRPNIRAPYNPSIRQTTARVPASAPAQPPPPQSQTGGGVVSAASIAAQIEAAKARIQRNLTTSRGGAGTGGVQATAGPGGARGGLHAELHPLLRKDQERPPSPTTTDKGLAAWDSKRQKTATKKGATLAPLPKFSTIKANKLKAVSPTNGEPISADGVVTTAAKTASERGKAVGIDREIANPYLAHLSIGKQGQQQQQQQHRLQAAKARKNMLNFVPQGKYVKQAEKIRERKREEEERRRAAITREMGRVMHPELDLVDETKILPQGTPASSVEWWDEPFISGEDKTYASVDVASGNEIDLSTVSHLVHHPIKLIPEWIRRELRESEKPIALMLTKKERKKLRRQRRMELHKEKQDKIRLGLLPPDPPKVRLANLMRVLGQEAVQDPTKVEKAVREQVAQRHRVHLETNEARKLTKEQLREKLKSKLEQDIESRGLLGAVFRVGDLTHPQHKYKIETNANQLGLTGIAIIYPMGRFSLVVVEGGEKALRAYKKLMLRRINWTDSNERSGGAVGKDRSGNRCNIVWTGELKRRGFEGFKIRKCDKEDDVRWWLRKGNGESFWDIAKQFDADEDAGLNGGYGDNPEVVV
ncbi:U4/U5/U6 small nuclear ribonucleoprotein prp3, partial [Spiromyces aspiralis]